MYVCVCFRMLFGVGLAVLLRKGGLCMLRVSEEDKGTVDQRKHGLRHYLI